MVKSFAHLKYFFKVMNLVNNFTYRLYKLKLPISETMTKSKGRAIIINNRDFLFLKVSSDLEI